MAIKDRDMMGAREAMVMAQQRRDVDISVPYFAPQEQHEDDKRVFTDPLIPNASPSKWPKNRKPVVSASLGAITGTTMLIPHGDGVGPSYGGAGMSDSGAGPSMSTILACSLVLIIGTMPRICKLYPNMNEIHSLQNFIYWGAAH
jgi:hypothetical protein